jgi:hypothetical protein
MRKLCAIGLCAVLMVLCLQADTVRSVFIPRSWHSVEELVQEAQRQTGIPLQLKAKDTLGKMVLYDNLTDLESVKEAVLEYYQYVLGQQVKWFRNKQGWLLRQGSPVELGLAMDLKTIEELWLKATKRGAFEFMDLPPDPPKKEPAVIEPKVEEETEVVMGEAPVVTPQTPSEEKLIPREPSGPYWLVGLWRRIYEQLERGGELERDRIRRLMRHEGLMGSVPLMELWLGKSIKEFLMEPGTYAESRPTRGMVRGAGELGAMGPSTRVTAHQIPLDSEESFLDKLPVIQGKTAEESDLETLDDLDLGEGRRLEKKDRDPTDKDGLVSSIPPRRFPQLPHVAFKWPRHIVTLTSKSWWENFWQSSRPKHPKEKKFLPPSRRALQRRDEAAEAFDRWVDWNQGRRLRDTHRRGEEP